MKKFLVAANWKMFKSPRQSMEFLKTFTNHMPEPNSGPNSGIESPSNRGANSGANSVANGRPESGSGSAHQSAQAKKEVIFFPSAVSLWVVQEFLNSTSYMFGAQNCYIKNEGAFTGETSPEVLFDMGCQYVLVGHSERRQLFNETDELLSLKVEASQKVGLRPMLCIGETLEQREGGHTHAIVTEQLRKGLSRADYSKPFTIAYEPVWAIGTGKTASSAQANEVHSVIRKVLIELSGQEVSSQTPILYGGSVKPENAQDLADQSEINGFLVGGASLEADKFEALVRVRKSI